MSVARRVVGIAVCALLYVAAFDIAGVAMVFVLDVVAGRYNSALLAYAVWFVVGVFCGLSCYGAAAGDKPGAQGAPSGALVIVTIAGVIAALIAACTLLLWRGRVAGDVFVPDNPALTVVFCVAILGGATLAHLAHRPDAGGRRKPRAGA